MESINLADAKAHFSDLVERASAGEEIEIMKRGKPMAKLVPVQKPKQPIDIEALRALTDRMTPQTESAGDFVRRMRDGDRY